MWWLILLAIVIIAIYLLYTRNSKKVSLSKEQLEVMKGLVEKEIEQIKAKKQEIIDKGAIEGKTIPLAPILENLENLKAEHLDDKDYIAEIDRQKNELKEKYGENIPVDEAYKIVTSFEDEYGPV